MTVAVVTDSSSCLPATLAAERGIALVPLHVLVDGIDHREGVDDIPEQSTSGKPVTTAGASPGELTEVYAAALERSRGAGVVALHISRGLSSTWEAARQAADHVGSAVRVVDSASAGMGLGFAVLAAAATAAGGAELDEVYHDAVAASTTSRCFIVVDRLDHLRRGGRIGTAAALLGTALAMKPVLHISDGKLVLREKTRTSSKALHKLVDAAVAAAAEVGDESGGCARGAPHAVPGAGRGRGRDADLPNSALDQHRCVPLRCRSRRSCRPGRGRRRRGSGTPIAGSSPGSSTASGFLHRAIRGLRLSAIETDHAH